MSIDNSSTYNPGSWLLPVEKVNELLRYVQSADPDEWQPVLECEDKQSVESPVFTEEQAAQYLQISVRELQRLARDREIDYVRYFTRKRFYTKEQLSEFIRRKTVEVRKMPSKSKRIKSYKTVPSQSNKGGDNPEESRRSIREEIEKWE